MLLQVNLLVYLKNPFTAYRVLKASSVMFSPRKSVLKDERKERQRYQCFSNVVWFSFFFSVNSDNETADSSDASE